MSTPWKGPLTHDGSNLWAGDELVALTIGNDGLDAERAAYLVRAANAHEGLRKALHVIAYEPIGDPEASAVRVLADVVDIARAALARSEGARRPYPHESRILSEHSELWA